ncbi:MAG: hypothetical protein AB7G93_23510 [Bdellovibrionales bacterium]
MSFSTLLFGNGLGRALDPAYFGIETGIRAVWDDEDALITRDSKQSIIQCLPAIAGARPAIPTGENDLEILHRVVTACGLISQVENGARIWLTDHGHRFPQVIEHLIGRIAHYFHRCATTSAQFDAFIAGVVTFVRENNAHVATLNYDNLLYQPLIDADILANNGHLLDGFAGLFFDESHMERFNRRKGWYLHLHGSPLFYDDGETIRKITQPNLDDSFDPPNVLHRHIVLNHTRIKPEIISGSKLLSTYWEMFGKALDESRRIVIFGYGGLDTHLNKRIAEWVRWKKRAREAFDLFVVERDDPAETRASRRQFWRERIGGGELHDRDFRLFLLPNILEFTWAELDDF